MGAPPIGVCSQWATIDDLCEPCDGYSFPAGLVDSMLDVASDILFVLSGKQFPGTCTETVRPCSQRAVYDGFRDRSVSAVVTFRSGCACNVPRKCGCPRPSEITLGVEPITNVTEVKVDGVVLDPSLYRVDDYKYLVRLPDAGDDYTAWPCCQNLLLADTEEDTFSVTFEYGSLPPAAGVHAAAVLACELALACHPIEGEECRLPKRIQSITRQGVSMVVLDPFDFLDQGKTGIMEVDLFLKTYNPNRLSRPATVVNVDLMERVRRIDT